MLLSFRSHSLAFPVQELDNPLILIIEKKVSGMASIIPVLELALKVRIA